MTKIKVCGITNLEDALVAVELGVKALGFVFYPKSPRYISPVKAREISINIHPHTLRIGVFVDEAQDKVLGIAKECLLDGLQFHGNESPEYCASFNDHTVIKALPLHHSPDLLRLPVYSAHVRAILVDAFDPARIGGTGKKANWELAREAKGFAPIILAGGLNETNIREALKIVNPYAVDISSGVEISPGVKDHKKLRRFVEAVRTRNGPI